MLKKLTALLICAVMLSLSVTVNAAESYTKEDISKAIDGIISYKSAILKADDTASFVQNFLKPQIILKHSGILFLCQNTVQM